MTWLPVSAEKNMGMTMKWQISILVTDDQKPKGTLPKRKLFSPVAASNIDDRVKAFYLS